LAGIFKWLFGGSFSGDARNAMTAREEPRGKARPEPEIIRVADPSMPGQPCLTQLERLTGCARVCRVYEVWHGSLMVVPKDTMDLTGWALSDI